MSTVEDLVPWLDEALSAPRPVPDIRERWPEITDRDAYALQLALMDARVASGARIVGYKAALTSSAMQRQIGIHEPMLGTLLASRVYPENEPVSLSARGFLRATLEPEVAVVLGTGLAGAGVTAVDAMAATRGLLPAVELGDYRTEQSSGRTLVGSVVCNTFNGGIVLGRPMTSPEGLDLRVEGMAMWLNGEPAGSGTGVEVLGDPFESVAFMANKLAEHGRSLEAGMILMTGSIVASVALSPGDDVEVRFTRLGNVRVRIAR